MLTMARNIDRKSTRLNSSHTVIYTLSLHDALPILTEIVLQLLAVELAFPPRYHQGGHAVADHVDHGAEHAHEAVDAQDQRHPGHGNRRDHHERAHQGDERSPLHSARTLRS